MKYRSPGERFALIVLAALAMWCGSAPASWAGQPSALPSVSDVVRVMGIRAGGHACPLEGGLLVTNAHVVSGETVVRWSDGQGNEGTAERDRVADDADLAVLHVLRGHVAREFHIAATAPAPGDRIVLRGYRYDNRKQIMSERRVETRVVRIEAGHLYFEDPGYAGSSGSCVFNAQGEVVAINKGGMELDSQGQFAGVGVGIWGEWAKDLEPPAEAEEKVPE